MAADAKFCSSCGLAFTEARHFVTPIANPALTPGSVAAVTASMTGASASEEAITRLNAALDGRYLVERELGKGGMATVYLARDVKHDREVAIKVLLPELSASIGSERFEREIKLAAKLQHPHILGLHDSGSALGLLYYVMPFVKGESLRDRLDREGQLPVEDAIVIALEVADALGHAHKQEIVHRDIKPENIMLSGGHALVADFGIARAATEAGAQKLTQTGMAVGTPVYMSPEQAGGESVGPTADIYSLGCVLYEMLAGEPPFTGKSPMAIMARHAMESVPSIRIVRSSVPEEVEAAIFASMGKVPADRPQSAAEFAEILGVPMAGTASMRAMGPTATRRIPTPHAGSFVRTPSGVRISAPAPRLPVWKRPAVVIGTLALVAVGGVGGWLALKGKGSTIAGENSRRVAVLYFTDQSNAKDLGPLADGLTEGLINSLSNASSITVISRSGVERFRGSDLQPDSIARALRAGYLVRGELDHDGSLVAVTVRLDDRSGANIDRKVVRLAQTNQLAMRDSLQSAVLALIKAGLNQEIQLKEERAGTANQEAWLGLQRAEQSRRNFTALLAKGDTLAINQALRVTDSLYAVVEQLDAKWAEPVTRRASLAYQRSRSVGRDPARIRPWVNEGLAHAGRALTLDVGSADALEVRGTLKYWSWFSNLETDPSKKLALLLDAEKDLEKATELNPRQATAWATLVSMYYQVPSKTNQDIFSAAQKAYDADEFQANANVVLNRLFLAAYDLKQWDASIQWCQTFASRFPTDYRSMRCRLYAFTTPAAKSLDIGAVRRIADSVVAMRPPTDTLLARMNTNQLIAAAMAEASKQRPALADSARRLSRGSLGDAEVDPPRDNAFYAARVFVILGDHPEAIKLLKEYFAANPQRAASFREDPGWWFQDIAKDAEFRRLVGAK